MKIGLKITGFFLIFTFSISLVFYFMGLRNRNVYLKRLSLEKTKEIKAAFDAIQEHDTKILFSSLEILIQDPGIKASFLKKDRAALYDYTSPLFRRLKLRYGITHFYFILPDGHVFLRVHEREIYGDLVKRHSFAEARDTKEPSWEIELGKTAFALRTVMPYYDNGRLIGYLELAEEITHFLKMLKRETKSEFAIIGEKEYLDRGDWESVRRVAGLRNNWDDLRIHLILGSTSGGDEAARCFTEGNLKQIEAGQSDFSEITGLNGSFVCSGFSLSNSTGRHIGAVLSLIDMSGNIAFMQKISDNILRMTIALFFVTFLGGMIISRRIAMPILEMSRIAKAIGKGDMDQRVNIRSSDEIGHLAKTFNYMIEMRKKADEDLRTYQDNLEKLVEKRSGEIKTLYDQLRHSQKMEAVGIFAGGIVHDFGNMLATIKCSLFNMGMKVERESPATKYIEQINSSVDRATRLIQSLLTFSSKQVMLPEPLYLNEVIMSARERILKILGREIEFTVALTEKNPVVLGDDVHIEQILLNLAANARDAMAHGGRLSIGSGVVQINDEFIKERGYGAVGEYALLSVSDTGIGMNEETREKIFEPFFTTKQIGKGTGLGLAITYGIVKQHKGYIEVNTKLDEGTTFNIYFPMSEGAVVKTDLPSSPVAAGSAETILLAEDDAITREAISETLTLSGYRVIEAADGNDALRLFDERGDEIGLVILDLIMPGKNGWEVYKEIKKNSPDAGVLLMSGYVGEIMGVGGLGETEFDFISKADPTGDVLRKIREMLDRRTQRKR